MYVLSSELGLSHTLCRQRVSFPPKPRGGGTHSPAGEGVGESQFRRLEKKLSTLPTLCLALTDSGGQVARSCGETDRHAGDILSLAYHAGRLYTAGDDGLIKVHKTSVLVIYTSLFMYCTHNLPDKH